MTTPRPHAHSRRWVELDRAHVWHPFTQMREWSAREPIVIVSGRGSILLDSRGRRYLDANSSIWTNLHGHRHPRIDAALKQQLGQIAHCSALGLANAPASVLAGRLVRAAARDHRVRPAPAPGDRVSGSFGRLASIRGNPALVKVFYSDDGSTALEVALKLAYEYRRRTGARRPRFLSLEGAYHGDTVGAVSLGHIDLFHRAYGGLLFRSDRAMAPYCYRCPFNRARAERVDARESRRCDWQCVDAVERQFQQQRKRGEPYAAFVYEPRIQGAAGMIPQPEGWLNRVAERARGHGALLIADEIMTGFGRTGLPGLATGPRPAPLFAGQHERVQPDFLCLAKGLTGGYLPMAATLTTQAVFDAFLGEYGEFKTFFHGHSYTANPLAAAASLASLDLLESRAGCELRRRLQQVMSQCLATLWGNPHVGDIRQVGLVAGVELVQDWRTRAAYDLRDRAGIRVCEAMARRGILTRPIGNVVVLMPPYCTTATQFARTVEGLHAAIREVLGGGAGA